MEEFVIELAGVPVRIRCRFQENRGFFQEYLSDKEPLFTVEPSRDDLLKMQADFDRTAQIEGHSTHSYSESFLENNAIHAIIAEKLVAYGVLLMHGSALCMDGSGYIFTAPSGTGKSTHTRLWREAFGSRVWMINDDKPMLEIRETGVTVWGTPWNGKHHLSRNACAPLKAIVSLHRGETNRIIPMSRADAFPVLMKQAYSSENPATMGGIIKLEKQLLNTVDFYKLSCNMMPEAAIVAWQKLSARN